MEGKRITPASVAEAAARAIDATKLKAIDPDSGREKGDTFDYLSTHVPGLQVLVEHGQDASELTREQAERLQELGGPYVLTAKTIEFLNQQLKKRTDGQKKNPHDELQGFYPDVRGARNIHEGWEVQLNPKTVHKFNPDLIVKSSDKAAEFVHPEGVEIVIVLNPGEDADGFIEAVNRRLKRQGLTSEEARKRISRNDRVRVDEDDLMEAEEKGEVVLLPGAHKVELSKPSVVPRIIATSDELNNVSKSLVKKDKSKPSS